MRCPHTVLVLRLAESLCLASEWRARGRGGTRQPRATSAVAAAARAGVQAAGKAPGERAEAHLGVQRRRAVRPTVCPIAAHPPGVSREARGSPALLPRPGGTGPSQRRSGACVCKRPPAPVDAPGWSALCLGQVVSPRGPEASGRRDWGAGPRWQLPKRPTCDGPGRGACPRCPSAGRRMLAPPCPGAQTRRRPAPVGSGHGQGPHRAARGGGFFQCQARLATGTGWGPRAAWRFSRARARSRSRLAAEGIRATATARCSGTAGSARRSAPPARLVL
jgi:hypothetical protein